MKLSDFNYNLPEELIAQYPLEKREQARLLVINRQAKSITHDFFLNLSKYLPKKSLIVLNNTKVIPARLLGQRVGTGGTIEVFLLKQLEDGQSFEVLIKPLKRLKDNDKIEFQNGLVAQLINREKRIVRFNVKDVYSYLDKIGHMPLPPYIKRPDEALDKSQYQTVFAKHRGSVAAPTAGLHFTKKYLSKLKTLGHTIEEVTLHVNYATFKSVEVEDITKHPMHYEDYFVAPSTNELLLKAKKQGQKIIAVGTTSCRVLETLAEQKKTAGSTNLFIYPGYKFKMVDCLITNFHQPYTTLLMLVSAFAGQELIKKAYQEAIDRKYRFFSYGDCMLIL